MKPQPASSEGRQKTLSAALIAVGAVTIAVAVWLVVRMFGGAPASDLSSGFVVLATANLVTLGILVTLLLLKRRR